MIVVEFRDLKVSVAMNSVKVVCRALQMSYVE